MSRPQDSTSHDPRDESERARAALKANAEMDFAALPAGPTDEAPSVTPATFGEASGFRDEPGKPPASTGSESEGQPG